MNTEIKLNNKIKRELSNYKMEVQKKQTELINIVINNIKSSGVDLKKNKEFYELIKPVFDRTFNPNAIKNIKSELKEIAKNYRNNYFDVKSKNCKEYLKNENKSERKNRLKKYVSKMFNSFCEEAIFVYSNYFNDFLCICDFINQNKIAECEDSLKEKRNKCRNLENSMKNKKSDNVKARYITELIHICLEGVD